MTVSTPTTETKPRASAVKAHPFGGTLLAPGRKGYQTRTILLAASELWPPDGRPPRTMAVGERNRMLWAWYERKGLHDMPSERHLRRMFNRMLKLSIQPTDMSADFVPGS